MNNEELLTEEVSAADLWSPAPEPIAPIDVGPDDDCPTSIGPYRISQRIASGGMASVYLGCLDGSAGIDKVVAVKQLHPHLAKERGYIEMFFDEARLASRINHPCVASVIHYGEADSRPYLVMEYLVGAPLSQVFKAISQAPALLLLSRYAHVVSRIVANLCEGLHAAHQLTDDDGKPLGLIHRDITPQNLFVAFDGSVRILDFGIARAEQRIHHTKTGILKGKLAYMAPEVFQNASTADRQSDVWSMGVVLHEMLTGKRLFRRASDIETILAVTRDDIPPPSRLNGNVPKELDAVVGRALQRNPKLRHGTARALARDLESCLGHLGNPVPASDVAEWIAGLFPESYAHRHSAISLARRRRTTPAEDPASGSESSPAAHKRGMTVKGEGRLLDDSAALLRRRFTGGIIGLCLLAGALTLGARYLLPLRAALTVAGAQTGPQSTRLPAAESRATATERSVVLAGTAPVVDAARAGREESSSLIAQRDGRAPDAIAEGSPAQPGGDRPRPKTNIERKRSSPAARRRADLGAMGSVPLSSPPAGMGQVYVNTTGGAAEIIFKGESRGRTPRFVSIPVGRQTLLLRHEGSAEPTTVEVNVPSVGYATVRVTLQNPLADRAPSH